MSSSGLGEKALDRKLDALAKLLRHPDPDISPILAEKLALLEDVEFEDILARFDPKETVFPSALGEAISRRALESLRTLARSESIKLSGLEQGVTLLGLYGRPDLFDLNVPAALDLYADKVREYTPEMGFLRGIVKTFHSDLGFKGNIREFHSPDNSYIHAVIHRRLGIPISLSTLALLTAGRLHEELLPIGSAGYFLLRTRDQGQESYLDCFGGWRILSRDEACLLVAETGGEKLPIVDYREVLARTIRNLTHIYSTRGESKAYSETAQLEEILSGR